MNSKLAVYAIVTKGDKFQEYIHTCINPKKAKENLRILTKFGVEAKVIKLQEVSFDLQTDIKEFSKTPKARY